MPATPLRSSFGNSATHSISKQNEIAENLTKLSIGQEEISTEMVIQTSKEIVGLKRRGRSKFDAQLDRHLRLPKCRLEASLLRRLAELYFEKMELSEAEFRLLGFNAAVELHSQIKQLEGLGGECKRHAIAILEDRLLNSQRPYQRPTLYGGELLLPIKSGEQTTLPEEPKKCDFEKQEKSHVLSILSRQILQAPVRHWPQAPTDFEVSNTVWRQLLLSIELGGNALLVGPPGCGKTELIGRLASGLGRRLEVFSFGAMSDPRTSLIGTTQYCPSKGTFFVDSRFVSAITMPNTLILLDEVNRADPDVTNMMLSVLDRQRTISIDETGRTVQVAAGVSFFATCNAGSGVTYSGTRPLDAAIRDRFSTIVQMDHLPQEREVQLLVRRERISIANALLLVKIANLQRRLTSDGEFDLPISTRMLLAVASKSLYVSLSEAIEFGILGHFSAAGGVASDRARLKQLLQKFSIIITEE